MRALNSRFLLIDVNSTAWHTSDVIPFQRLTCASSFRRASAARQRTTSSKFHSPSTNSHEPSAIRRPSDRKGPGNAAPVADTANSASTSARESDWAELETFMEILPARMRKELTAHEGIGSLIEVVMDLGRKPLARFPSGDWVICEQPVKYDDLKHAISKVGDFSDDNRSGIDRSLHRISAIRNRRLEIIGLTCRVGRAVSGSAEIIRDLVEGGGSILVIGRPGVGKTTLIRETARMLADEHKKRVVIVDTSNEIGGDGDVPHIGIGRARRMQVPNVQLQHNVMIEAVENHMPETIIIDEIGSELEALAASTIAQRGVQLVGTAHGLTIENIIKNPSLQVLVGGIESVTLGDEEAKRRKVQKTILERKGPPTFTCAVEMISRTECRVHPRLDLTVDSILAGKTPPFEVRHMHAEEDDSIKLNTIPSKNHQQEIGSAFDRYMNVDKESDDADELHHYSQFKKGRKAVYAGKRISPVYVYTHEIADADLLQVAEVLGLEDELDFTDDLSTADAVLASGSGLKKNPWIRGVAKSYKLPIFVTKSTTMAQMVKAVRMILGRESFSTSTKQMQKASLNIEIEDDAPERKPTLEELDALEEVRLAIEYIVIPGGEPVELLPRRSDIIARQLELVESYHLAAENLGTPLNPRLQILPHRVNKTPSLENSTKRDSSGSTVTRLPLLPE